MTDTLNSTDARENLAEILNRVAYAKDRVRITRRGKEVAAVVPIEDLELIERLEDEIDNREARKALDRRTEARHDPLGKGQEGTRALRTDDLHDRDRASCSATAQETRSDSSKEDQPAN